MVDPLEILAAHGGVARAQHLAPNGAARRRLASLVAAGDVMAHAGGCYSLPGAEREVVHALVARARLTCVSAALVHGLAVFRPAGRTHLAVPHAHGALGSRPRTLPRATVLHREQPALLTAYPHPHRPHGEPLVVAAAKALARLLRCQDELTAVAAVDSALNRRLCSVRDIDSLLRGPGSARPRALLQECDGRSQSAIESVARVALRRAGYQVEANVHVAGVGFVDLLVEGRIVVELDGFAYHGDRAAYREDRRRDRRLAAQGFLALRFAWEDVVHDPPAVARAVADVLATGR